ncbi:heat shock 70 kDa protein 12A [Magallana gigas]|uniref:heat shock 70 kDa protein 12A n=1 Tax=Magallana gigas TaxID=29159 RepID=UPI0033428DD9
MGTGKLPVQVSEFPSKYKWDIIVAFDIGTSYSGYAYSDKKEIETNTINLNEWTGNSTLDPKAKAPTTVLLNEDQTFDSFGYEAEERYAQRVEEKTHNKCYRFRNFKMKLYHEKNITEAFVLQDDRGKLSLPAMVIFVHTIKALKTHFENAAENRGVVFKPENVLYVFTVPAIWSESAKEFMRKAAIKADIAEYQIVLALEPEAAALYCKNLPDRMLTESFEPGTKYMVLDMGGGTIDIVVHKIMEDGTLAEVYKASGGDWGGTIVDAQFKDFVNELFKNKECFENLWELAPLDALDFEREFEAKKRQISSNTKGNIRLQLPARLMQFANTAIQKEHKQTLTLAHMHVQNDHFKSFFTTPKDKIIGILKNILVEIGTINFIILVGGFSGSKFLTDEIKNNPAFSSIKFISPNEPGTVVLKGAVLFGYNPRAVSARICRYTYGFSVLEDFDSKIHPQSKHIIVDEEEKCDDVFSVLVYKDELVKYEEERTHMTYSSHRNEDRKFVTLKDELFQAKNVVRGQLAFVTDEGFKAIGKVVSTPPENGWPDRVDHTTKIYFGQTSIRIECCDTANKEKIKASFELEYDRDKT